MSRADERLRSDAAARAAGWVAYYRALDAGFDPFDAVRVALIARALHGE